MSTPPQFDPVSLDLRRELYYFLVATLAGMLPGPPDESPEQSFRRYHAAISQVATLRPANHDEALTAARYVAAGAHADEALRLATYHADNPAVAAQLYRQYGSMMREARGCRALLLRVQAARHRRDNIPAARQQDAATAHTALHVMTEALVELAPQPQRAPPPPVAKPPAKPQPAPRAGSRHPVQSLNGKDIRPLAEAILRQAALDNDKSFRVVPEPAAA